MTLTARAGQVAAIMTRRRLKLAAAESCTGGLIADTLTDIAGSSEFFLGSLVTYANSAKTGVLAVDERVLKEHGAVSEATVRAMAEGARRALGADYAVATSGIAGPGGASEGKPVGLVWLAVAGPGGTVARSRQHQGERRRNKLSFANSALELLLEQLRAAGD